MASSAEQFVAKDLILSNSEILTETVSDTTLT